MNYHDFLARKSQLGTACGFEPSWLPDFLYPFQRSLVGWAVRKGRAAVFADCGLGKTPIQLAWAENVVRHTNRPVLVLTPLGVSAQTVREAEKFGLAAVRCRDGRVPPGARLVVTNYDRLHYFDPADFAGVVADESGCLKHWGAKRTAAVTEFMRTLPYRLLCTATAAPNDYVELGTSAETLGELGYADMLTRFFKQQTSKDRLGWGRTKYFLRPHAAQDFWRWVCSWARACRRPSDLGCDDGPFLLPGLLTEEHVVTPRTPRPGLLFDLPAVTLEEEREERRRTLAERCERVAALVNGTGRPAICWCHLNPEAVLLKKLIPDAVEVGGSDADDSKEEKLLAFTSGRARVMVSKPVVFGWGLNLQHCAHMTFFPSHSFEMYYQSVRRCWRFGQQRPVKVDVVTSPGERGVLDNLNRKAAQAEALFTKLVALMNDQLNVRRGEPFTADALAPAWLRREPV